MNFRSIKFKFTFSLTFVLIIILLLTLYIVINVQRHQIIEEALLSAKRVSNILKGSIQYAMTKNHRKGIQEVVTTIGEQKGMEWIRVVDKVIKKGEVKFSTREGEIGLTSDKNAPICYPCHSTGRPLEEITPSDKSRFVDLGKGYQIVATVEPIYNNKTCYTSECHMHPESQRVLGVLDIGVSLAEMEGRLSGMTYNIIAFGIISILVTCTFAIMLVQRQVSSPIKQLLTGTERIMKGDLDYTIPVSGNDEVAQLAKSFNTMTMSLKKAYSELQDWAKTLENRVEEKSNELKDKERQMIRAEKMASLGEMAAGIAHELNNPLTGILTFASLIQKKLPASSSEHTDIGVVINETQRCSKIIKKLLDFARESKAEKRLADINDVIEEVIFFVRPQIQSHNIKVNQNLDRTLPMIMIDRDQIKQVAINIILNAVESMPKSGTLTISTSLRKDVKLDYLPAQKGKILECIEIEFTDTGCGVPPENLEKIFNPFFTTKEPGKGTGLGLPVSLGLVGNHGGTIKVTSEVNNGSTFTVILPVRETV